jgi:hypothetical protein
MVELLLEPTFLARDACGIPGAAPTCTALAAAAMALQSRSCPCRHCVSKSRIISDPRFPRLAFRDRSPYEQDQRRCQQQHGTFWTSDIGVLHFGEKKENKKKNKSSSS